MSTFYKFQYMVGMTPWERMSTLPSGDQAFAFIDREESGREPPHGRVLDLGCGTGVWSVRLDVMLGLIIPTVGRPLCEVIVRESAGSNRAVQQTHASGASGPKWSS